MDEQTVQPLNALSGGQTKDRASTALQQRSAVRPLLAVGLPAIVAFAVLYLERLPVPYQDDYNVILAFATHYQHLPTWPQKLLYVLTYQTNDYKLGFEHAVIALQLELTGHLNFSVLVAIGDLFLLPIAYLLWRIYCTKDRDLAQQLTEFVPISFLFFSLAYWEALNWAMASLQGISVIFFSLLSIYLLFPKETAPAPGRARVLLSCISAMLAAFCSANGFFLAPIGLWVLLRRRSYASSFAWCASFVPPVACYLYRYVPYQDSLHAMHRTWLIPKFVYHFFGFLGCAIPVRPAAALLGMAILAVLFLAVLSRFDQENSVAFYFTGWILITAVVVAWVRGLSVSRYSIYSILLLIFCYTFLRENLPRYWASLNARRFYSASVALTAMFCLFSDIDAYRHLGARRRMVFTGLAQYRANPDANSPMIDPAVHQMYPAEEEYERVTLNNAIQEHVYTLP
jgi:hypothetical protein